MSKVWSKIWSMMRGNPLGTAVIVFSFTAFAGIMFYIVTHPQKPAPATVKVSDGYLLHYRGIDTTEGNRLIGVKAFVESHSSSSGSLVLGSGSISSKSSSNVVLLLSFEAKGNIQQMLVSYSRAHIHVQAGSASVKFSIAHPTAQAYRVVAGTSPTNPRDDGYDDGTYDYNGYADMSAVGLLTAFGAGVNLYIDQATFGAAFGGTH